MTTKNTKRYEKKKGVIAFLCLVLGVIGCNSGGPPMCRVTGTVTFDSKQVDDGEIIFVPMKEGVSPDAGPIKNGQFDLMVKEGPAKVQIRASREVLGKRTDMGALYEQYIPERYNAQTTLREDIVSGAPNRFEYALESKAK